MSEISEIERRYSRRKESPQGDRAGRYTAHMVEEREALYRKILSGEVGDPANKTLLEIGAGTGSNIPFFLGMGFRSEHIAANELLPERARGFRQNFPGIRMLEGNALDISEEEKFDVVFQSTVFSSILDEQFRKQLAEKMLRLLKPGGIILSYDFVYNNPSNTDVKKLSRPEIIKLFPGCDFKFYKVTLAPPLGRKLPGLYKILNFFPFLRTHLVAVIKKK